MRLARRIDRIEPSITLALDERAKACVPPAAT